MDDLRFDERNMSGGTTKADSPEFQKEQCQFDQPFRE